MEYKEKFGHLISFINVTTDYSVHITRNETICITSDWYVFTRYFKTMELFKRYIFRNKIVDKEEFDQWIEEYEKEVLNEK